MGKIAASDYAKIANYVSNNPNEFKKTPNILLFFIKCSESVRHDKKVFVDNHMESMKHRNSSATPNQSFLYAPKLPDFNERVVKAFLGANIPLKKVRNLDLRKLFTDIGQPLPCETSCRKKVEEIAKDDENRLRDILNLPEVKNIIRRFEFEGQLVARAVEAVRSCNVDYELTEISRCYQNLLPLMAKMEGSTCSIFEE